MRGLDAAFERFAEANRFCFLGKRARLFFRSGVLLHIPR